MQTEMQIVWITKSVFTNGVYEAEFVRFLDIQNGSQDTRTAIVKDPKCDFYERIFYEGDWHKTEAEAKVKANEMRLKKIKSLEKQIEKLKKLEF